MRILAGDRHPERCQSHMGRQQTPIQTAQGGDRTRQSILWRRADFAQAGRFATDASCCVIHDRHDGASTTGGHPSETPGTGATA